MTQQLKDEVIDHLARIGVTDIVYERFIALLQQCESICPEAIVDTFVTDQSSDDGRTLINLWFFSESYVLEAKNFQLATEFDLTLVRSNVDYVSIKAENFLLGTRAQKASYLLVNASLKFPRNMSIQLVASGENCNELDRILKQHLLPNILRPSL